jgi:hypothetical protein
MKKTKNKYHIWKNLIKLKSDVNIAFEKCPIAKGIHDIILKFKPDSKHYVFGLPWMCTNPYKQKQPHRTIQTIQT